MRLLQKYTQNFATLHAQFLSNKNRNAVRFHSQNVNFNFEELNYHVEGLINGLRSLKLGPSATFLIKTLPFQQCQAYITKIGVAGIGAKLIISQASTASQLDEQLRENNINCIIFEPDIQIQKKKLIDILNDLAVELSEHYLGQPLKFRKYPHLKRVVQTNFYSFRGVIKFKSLLNYSFSRYYQDTSINFNPAQLPASSNPIIITDPADDFAFRAGILNSLINGRYVQVVKPSQLNQVCKGVFNNEVDLIGTTQTYVDEAVRVIVEKGSNKFLSHSNRVEI